MANNRICLTCGKSYEYCSSCSDNLNMPVWKNLFHCENCKMVFEVVSDYSQKVITKESAKEKLSKCDLSHTNDFKEKIKKLVNEIVTDETKPVNEKTVKPVAKVIKRNNKNKIIEND